MKALVKYKLLFGLKLIQLIGCNAETASCKGAPTLASCISNTRKYQASPLTLQSSPEMQNDTSLLEEVKKVIPPLTHDQHKGQAGRIGVIGGSEEYTGGPYFAAISAVKVGADLSHVFCMRAASPVIKSYSPELIVHPLLDAEDARNKIKEWLPRMNAFVIGPGLGRHPSTLGIVTEIIADIRARNTPIVVDADALFLVTSNPETIKGYKRAILTPNKIEFQRLYKAMNGEETKLPGISDQKSDQAAEETIVLSKLMGGVTIVRKGKVDIIAQDNQVLKVTEVGNRRRCGGQGDLLAGSMATFLNWAHLSHVDGNTTPPGMLAGYAACVLTKKCAKQAFEKHGRSLTTSDMIEEIHKVFDENFEHTLDVKG